jgi:pilus assembly protein CpaC
MESQIGRLAGMAALAVALAPALALGQSSAEDLKITVGKSVVVDYPTDVARISTSNPEIVDAVAVSTREVLLHAKSHGASTVVIWARTGQRTFYNVSVEHNLEPIRRILKETYPDDQIQIGAARDSVTINGRVSDKATSERVAALVASLSKTVVNNLTLSPNPVEKQILLRVKFAEIDRKASKAFGVNLISTGAGNTPGSISTGQFGPPSVDAVAGSIPGRANGTKSEFTLSDVLNVFAFRPDLNLAATIRALQNENVLQILAEPNLVTTNGKEATFLVGGEFPIPVLQGGSNAGAVTIQFREFGIRLQFNPLLTPHNTLKMYVKPEVSSIDITNSITFGGFRIPALSTRRIETNIELAAGQSFVIGGLIDDRIEDSVARIPGLSNIPILGTFFKSRSESKAKTELIILVTPEIVDPLNPGDAKPMPVMPKEFLGPVPIPGSSATRAPNPKKSAALRKNSGAAQNAKAQQKPAAVAMTPAGPVDSPATASDNLPAPPVATPEPAGKPSADGAPGAAVSPDWSGLDKR